MIINLSNLSKKMKIGKGYYVSKKNIKLYFLLTKEEKKEAYIYLIFFAYLNNINFILNDLKKINRRKYNKIIGILEYVYSK